MSGACLCVDDKSCAFIAHTREKGQCCVVDEASWAAVCTVYSLLHFIQDAAGRISPTILPLELTIVGAICACS